MQLVSVSMKLKQMFYTQIERRIFHTAWVKNGSVRARAARPFYSQTRKSLRSFGHVVGLGEQRGRHAALPFVAADDGIAAAEAVECFEPGLAQNSTIHPLRSTG